MPRGLREHFHKMVASFKKETKRIKFSCFPFFVKKIVAKGKGKGNPTLAFYLISVSVFGIIGE